MRQLARAPLQPGSRTADARGLLSTDVLLLLALSGALACAALLAPGARRASRLPRLLALVSAALFGTAIGLRAAGSESPLPVAPRFVGMASFSTLAFHRSWCWIRSQLG